MSSFPANCENAEKETALINQVANYDALTCTQMDIPAPAGFISVWKVKLNVDNPTAEQSGWYHTVYRWAGKAGYHTGKY